MSVNPRPGLQAHGARHRCRAWCVSGWAMLALLGPARAAETPDLTSLPLEALLHVQISTASKLVQDRSQAPSAVQVIDAATIARHGWRTLSEALDSLPGIYAGQDGEYHYVGARGFMVAGDYATRFLMLLDGHRLNDNVYEQASFGEEFVLDLSLVDRIEVVPGPGSALYGSNAFFGVINVITRQGGQAAGARTSVRLSRDGWKELVATYALNSGDGGPALTVSLARAVKAGRDVQIVGGQGLPLPDGSPSPDGWTRGLDRSARTRAYAGLQWNHLSLSAWGVRRDVQPSMPLFGINIQDARHRVQDRVYGIGATWAQPLASEVQFEGRLNYQVMDYVGRYPYQAADMGSYVERDEGHGRWWSGEARWVLGGLVDHRLVLGLDFQYDVKAALRNEDEADTGRPALAVDGPVRRQGVFVHDEWTLAPGWRLNAGIRHDRLSTGLHQSSPRLALIWSTAPDTTLKLIGGRAFRVPNLYERSYQDAYTQLNPALGPERIVSRELVLEQQLSTRQTLSVSLFHHHIEGLISLMPISEDVSRFVNLPVVRSQGLESDWAWRDARGARLALNLALNHTRRQDGHEVANSPRWVGKAKAAWPLGASGWLLAAEFRATGPRSLDTTPQRLGTQAWWDLSLQSAEARQGSQLRLRITNLFNRRLEQPVGEAPVPVVPLAGRGVQFTWEHGF